jgi:hypothetical protein
MTVVAGGAVRGSWRCFSPFSFGQSMPASITINPQASNSCVAQDHSMVEFSNRSIYPEIH